MINEKSRMLSEEGIKIPDFFTISRKEVLATLAPETVEFYRGAEYLDLTSGDLNVGIEPVTDDSGKILDNISYVEGKKIITEMGFQLPSVALMYQVIIPYLMKNSLEDRKLGKALESMVNNFEFLEDVIIQKGEIENKYALHLRIGERETSLNLPHEVKSSGDPKFWDYQVNGSFDLTDLNDLGFPIVLKDKGKLKYWGPSDFNMPIGKELYPYGGGPQGETSCIRCSGETLDLLLTFRPRGSHQDNLGLRGIRVV